MTRGGYVICWIAALTVATAPLPFGSVDPLPAAALQLAVLACVLLWISDRRLTGQPPLPWRDPLLLGGTALFAYGLLQMVPMPAGLMEVLSPAAGALKATYSPEPTAWTALSLDPYATWRSCLSIACWTLMALMVRHSAIDLKGRLVVAGGVVAGGLFQAGYGLFEFISGRQHIFGYQKKYFTDVATGTFISRNNYAGYLEMAIPMALALALLALGRSRTAGTGQSPSLGRKLASATGQEGFRALLLLMGGFLMATGLLMSRSRMGIISIAFALMAGSVVLGMRERSRRFALISVAVAVLVLIFASQIDILPVIKRFEGLRNEFGTGYGRLRVWTQAMPMLAAYPLFGSGMGTWEMAFSPFRDDMAQMKVDFAHNDYLEFVAEAGLTGTTILIGAAAFVLLKRGPRGRGAPRDEIALAAGAGLLAIGLHSLTDFHLSIPADALTAAVLAGLLLRPSGPVATSARTAPAPAVRAGSTGGASRRRPAAGTAYWLCAAGLVGLGVMAVSPAAAQLKSEPTWTASREDIQNVDAGALTTSAADPDEDLCAGCRLEPFNAARYFEAASRARRRLLKDVEVISQAQTRGILPDPETRLYLARRLDAALSLVREGLSMAPSSGRGHLEAGLLRFGRFALTGLPPQASEDFDVACEAFARALSLQPWRAASHRKVARVLSPFWEECSQKQRQFIARAVRRAHKIDPWAKDIKAVVARIGL